MEVLPRLVHTHNVRELKCARHFTKAKRATLEIRVEPTPVSLLDCTLHKSIQSRTKVKPSPTGIPVTGKGITISTVRLLKEINDSLCGLLSLAKYPENVSFVKQKTMFISHLLSQIPGAYNSWFIRRMKTLIYVHLRGFNHLKTHNVRGSQLSADRGFIHADRRSLIFKPELPRDFGYRNV